MENPKKIQALKNYPNGGSVKKGEIGTLVKDRIYDFPSQSGYWVEIALIGIDYKIIEEKEELNYEIY